MEAPRSLPTLPRSGPGACLAAARERQGRAARRRREPCAGTARGRGEIRVGGPVNPAVKEYSMSELVIDVVSDAVCPWCFVGKRRLEAALAQSGESDVAVRWRPFQLDPTIPPED